MPVDMPGNTSGPGALAAVDADHVYVLAGNEVFLATDNGGTWSTRRVAGVEFPCASLVDPCAGQDGGDATSMALFAPRGIAVAPDGGLYIAEASVPPRPGETSPGGWVRRLTPDGRLFRFAGTGTYGSGGDAGPALEAQLGGPTGVAVAPDGAVIIADLFASRVRRVTTDGRIQTIGGDSTYTGQVDTGPAVGPVFVAPVSVTVDTRGYVYVLDMGTGLLRRIAPGAAEVLGAAVASFVPVAPTRACSTRERWVRVRCRRPARRRCGSWASGRPTAKPCPRMPRPSCSTSRRRKRWIAASCRYCRRERRRSRRAPTSTSKNPARRSRTW